MKVHVAGKTKIFRPAMPPVDPFRGAVKRPQFLETNRGPIRKTCPYLYRARNLVER